ncbi:MAG: class I SAM-dependent methyltransferase [Vicinamibacterales bacterium]
MTRKRLAVAVLSLLAALPGRIDVQAQRVQNGGQPRAPQLPRLGAPDPRAPRDPGTRRRGPQPLRQRRLFPPQDLGLLSAPDRDEWNKPDLIMDALGIADGAVVADIGAGGGWFTLRLARRVGPNGLVYAQDIQPQMIEAINRRVQQEGLSNVRTVLGTETDPRLPSGLDAILIVDAYQEMDEPGRPEVLQTLLRKMEQSLKPQGRLGVIDFMPGSGGPGPSAEDRVSPDTVIAAVEAAGLQVQTREPVPPFQYLLVFGKASAARAQY